jgi:hypothetical protein
MVVNMLHFQGSMFVQNLGNLDKQFKPSVPKSIIPIA